MFLFLFFCSEILPPVGKQFQSRKALPHEKQSLEKSERLIMGILDSIPVPDPRLCAVTMNH